MTNYFRRIVFIVLGVLCLVGCDAATKKIAHDELIGKGVQSFAAGHLHLVYMENSGGMLSMGNQLPEKVKFWIFTVGVSIIILVLLVITIMKKELSRWMIFCFTLFISGGIGNLIDRITNEGRVIDFIVIELFGFRTGVFNIADFYITVGVILLILVELIEKLKPKPPTGISY